MVSKMSRSFMPPRYTVAFLLAPLALACSCKNSTPIMPSIELYRDHAVFTACVIQSVGRTFASNGEEVSVLAFAVVHQKYRGLPWYWPKVVL